MAVTSDLFPDVAPAPPVVGHEGNRSRSAVEWILVVVGAVAVALLIKSFVMQAFYIPSESMQPTLGVGDRVLVNKLSYRLHGINRGDVVVFEKPAGAGHDEIKDLIKRVIGLPGDKVVYLNDQVYINDHLLNEPYLPKGTSTQPGPGTVTWTAKCTRDDPCVIPEGSVWVMGDNRTNSSDSRYIGPIDENLIIGRAFVIVWPPDRLSGI
jgi:signal peptidase I